MADATFYREQAKQHRERAAKQTNPKLADQMLRFAEDYEALAAMIDAENGGAPPSS